MKAIIVILILLLIVMPGCSGTFQRTGEEKSGAQKSGRWETSPLDLPEDNTIVPQKYPIPNSTDTASNVAGRRDSTAELSHPPGAYESYRIQIFNSKTYGPAVRETNIAREIFDQKIWLDYEVPYYKVRVGDFPNRRKAEEYLPKVKSAGYSAAWVVRVNINLQTLEDNISQTAPPIDSIDNEQPSTEPGDDSTSHPPR